MIQVENNKKTVLGIDVGGTKLAAGVVDSAGHIFSYLRDPTVQAAGTEGMFEQLVNLAQRALAESGQAAQVESVGVGCGGPMLYPAGIVSPLHIPAWRDFPLRERIEQGFGRPTVVDNDAKALALGEALLGAGQGVANLLGMVVSTGVGGGIVINGKLQHGASGNAGHIGHFIVDANGPLCECGKQGCLTAYTSGTGIAHRARLFLQQESSQHENSILSQLSGSPSEITAQTVALAAKQGDKLALRLFREAVLALAIALVSTTNLLDLDLVVIGGGVADTGETLFFEPLRQEIKRLAAFPFAQRLQVVPTQLGQEAGVLGAACLVF